MKKMIFSLVLLLTGAAAYAQNDLKARMELENAETAYSENRVSDALEYLDKTQKLVGWSHRIAYIRILCLDRLCNYRDAGDPYTASLQSELKMYMDYANRNPERVERDRFREIYAVEEKFTAHEAERKLNEQATREWARISDSEDLPTLQTFIATYAGTPLAATARQRIAQITRRRLDEEAAAEWARIGGSEDVPALQAFAEKYSGTPSGIAARQRVEQIIKLREAAAEWARIGLTADLQELSTFLRKYKDTPQEQPARQRYDELKKREEMQQTCTRLQQELKYYKKKRTKSIIWSAATPVALGVGVYCINGWISKGYKSEYGEAYVFGSIFGTLYTVCGAAQFFKIKGYSSQIRRLEGEIDKTRAHLSLQPVIMPVNAYDTGLSTGNMAYGVRVAITF